MCALTKLKGACAIGFILGSLLIGMIILLVSIISLFTPYFWVTLPYLAWQYYDLSTPERGGRPSKVRHWGLWKWIASYFPAKLHRQVELPPNKNYLFCHHPHGLLPFGAILNLATDASGFSQIFRGLSQRTIMLLGNFYVPFHREAMLNLGMVPASRDSISYLMNRRNGIGRAVVLMVGGAREMNYSKPGEHVFLVKSRRGFVRIALEQGASLVPVITFGEVNVYEPAYYPEGSLIRRIQDLLERWSGMPMPMPRGDGILPKQCALNTVVGKPIDVDRVPKPTEEQVEKLHAKYVKALTDLFDSYKTRFGVDSGCQLTIV